MPPRIKIQFDSSNQHYAPKNFRNRSVKFNLKGQKQKEKKKECKSCIAPSNSIKYDNIMNLSDEKEDKEFLISEKDFNNTENKRKEQERTERHNRHLSRSSKTKESEQKWNDAEINEIKKRMSDLKAKKKFRIP